MPFESLLSLTGLLGERESSCACSSHRYPGIMHVGRCCGLGMTTRGHQQEDQSHDEAREEHVSCDLEVDTEDEIDHDDERNDEAYELNRKGRHHLKKRNLVEAKKNFWKAYIKCTSDYYEKDDFKENYDKVNDRIHNEKADDYYQTGQDFFEEEDFEEAFKYFEEAYKTCTYGYRRENKFTAKMDLAKEKICEKNRQADQLNCKGLKAMKQKKFEEAIKYFQSAYQMCSDGYRHEAEFKENKAEAKSELETASKKVKADQLNRKGLVAMTKKKLDKALQYFGEAYKTCPPNDHERRTEYEANKKKAIKQLQKLNRAAEKAKERADLFEEGMELWEKAWKNEEEGDHVKAAQFFEEALEIFKKCGKSATEVVQLVKLKIEGNTHFNDGVQHQEEGNWFLGVNELDQSLDRYNRAKENLDEACAIFDQGAQTGESRFGDCKKIVEEYVTELTRLMQLVQEDSLAASLRGLTFVERPASDLLDEDFFDTTITPDHFRMAPNLVVDAN